MKILYIANARMPTEKAHGLQIMKTCEAFADLGHEVTLVVTTRKTGVSGDPFDYYRVRKNFALQRVWSWDLVHVGKIGFLIQYISFSLSAIFSCNASKFDAVYSRDELALLWYSFRYPSKVVWETHVGAWNAAARIVAHRARRVVAITQGLKDWYVQKEIDKAKILVAPDGVDLRVFEQAESMDAARQRLGIAADVKIALYIGRLDGWKGIEVLCKASALLPPLIRVAVIGGDQAQIASLRTAYPLVQFLGYRPYSELPDNQAAADLLVIPNTAKDEISSRFTSPLKLFTYMAANRPIIASDLPSIREVLDDASAYFFKPDDPGALAHAIQLAATDPEAVDRASRARAHVQAYTWEARARTILAAIG